MGEPLSLHENYDGLVFSLGMRITNLLELLRSDSWDLETEDYHYLEPRVSALICDRPLWRGRFELGHAQRTVSKGAQGSLAQVVISKVCLKLEITNDTGN